MRNKFRTVKEKIQETLAIKVTIRNNCTVMQMNNQICKHIKQILVEHPSTIKCKRVSILSYPKVPKKINWAPRNLDEIISSVINFF